MGFENSKYLIYIFILFLKSIQLIFVLYSQKLGIPFMRKVSLENNKYLKNISVKILLVFIYKKQNTPYRLIYIYLLNIL